MLKEEYNNIVVIEKHAIIHSFHDSKDSAIRKKVSIRSDFSTKQSMEFTRKGDQGVTHLAADGGIVLPREFRGQTRETPLAGVFAN